MFRINPSYLALLTADLANIRLYSSREKTFRSSFRRESKAGFGRNASIRVGAGETVPRADLLAGVATVKAAAEANGLFGRDFSAVFDGEIGEAFSGVRWHGPSSAPVGQASRQRLQLPQRFFCGVS